MSSPNASRSHAVLSVASRRRDAEYIAGGRPADAGVPSDPTEYFGCNVFDDKAMRRYLPKDVYKSLRKTIDLGRRLDPAVADVVANAMKTWAMERGADHYTHVFYPLTGLTAEKHDSFLCGTPSSSLLRSCETFGYRVCPSGPLVHPYQELANCLKKSVANNNAFLSLKDSEDFAALLNKN